MNAVRHQLARRWRMVFIVVCSAVVAAVLAAAVEPDITIAATVALFAVVVLWLDSRLQTLNSRFRQVATKFDQLPTNVGAERRAATARLDAALTEIKNARIDIEKINGLLVDQRADLERQRDQHAKVAARLTALEHDFGQRLATAEKSLESVTARARHVEEQVRGSLLQRLTFTETAVADLEDQVEERSVMSDLAHDEMRGAIAATRPEVDPIAETSSDTESETARTRRPTRPIRVYWWRHPSRRTANFGDELSRLIVASLTDGPVVHASVERCDLVAIGSVLEHVMRADREAPVPVWGAGFISVDGEDRPNAVIPHAARGRLTAARLGGAKALGDPGLLAGRLVEPGGKKFSIGLVAHLVDRDHPMVEWFTSNVAGSVAISPLQPPLDVIAQIGSCDRILSSSLHGMIVADSLGVPNQWVQMSDGVIGSGFKFRDHLSCFGIDDALPLPLRDPSDMATAAGEDWSSSYERPGIDELTERLVAAFPGK